MQPFLVGTHSHGSNWQQLAALLSPNVAPADKRAYAALLSESLWSMQRSRIDYSRILIADPQGTILISPEQNLVGRKVANPAALTGTLNAGPAPSAGGSTAPAPYRPEVYVQGISFNECSGKYEMCFGHVIYAPDSPVGERSAIIGVLLITADMSASIYKIREDWRMGETGTAVLSHAEAGGTRILNPVRFDETKPLERFLPLVADTVARPTQLAARGHSGTGLTTDHLGKPVFTVYQFIPESEWGLVLKMNTSEIFASLYVLVLQVLLLALGVLLVATLASLLIAKTLINPLDQLLVATRAVASGDLSVVVASDRQDEIGTLARAFSEMVVKLDHHQQQLKAVNQIATGILGAQPSHDVLHHLVQTACQLTNATGAAIHLTAGDQWSGRPAFVASAAGAEKSMQLSLPEDVVALFINDERAGAPLDLHRLLTSVSSTVPNIITTPIEGRAQRLGALRIYKPADPEGRDLPLSQADEETLAALTDYAAIVVENDRLVAELKRWNSQLEAKVADRTREIEAANAQLTVLDEMKTEFIYSVSHELRNPITNLKLQLDLLRNNADSPRRERYVAAIAKQVDLMALLIGDMLDLIQIDKMKNQIEFAPSIST